MKIIFLSMLQYTDDLRRFYFFVTDALNLALYMKVSKCVANQLIKVCPIIFFRRLTLWWSFIYVLTKFILPEFLT